MQASNIRKPIDPFVGNFNLDFVAPMTDNKNDLAPKKSLGTIFSGSPKAFKIILLTVGLISFSSGFGFTVNALAPDEVDLQRQEVLDQQFSAVANQQVLR